MKTARDYAKEASSLARYSVLFDYSGSSVRRLTPLFQEALDQSTTQDALKHKLEICKEPK